MTNALFWVTGHYKAIERVIGLNGLRKTGGQVYRIGMRVVLKLALRLRTGHNTMPAHCRAKRFQHQGQLPVLNLSTRVRTGHNIMSAHCIARRFQHQGQLLVLPITLWTGYNTMPAYCRARRFRHWGQLPVLKVPLRDLVSQCLLLCAFTAWIASSISAADLARLQF